VGGMHPPVAFYSNSSRGWPGLIYLGQPLLCYRGVVQLVERLILDQKVEGSNPSTPTIFMYAVCPYDDAVAVDLDEHENCVMWEECPDKDSPCAFRYWVVGTPN
jgi:hypothetical protein